MLCNCTDTAWRDNFGRRFVISPAAILRMTISAVIVVNASISGCFEAVFFMEPCFMEACLLEPFFVGFFVTFFIAGIVEARLQTRDHKAQAARRRQTTQGGEALTVRCNKRLRSTSGGWCASGTVACEHNCGITSIHSMTQLSSSPLGIRDF